MTRVGLIDECPGGTSRSDPRSRTYTNPEEEGCCGAPEEVKGDTKKAAQEDREDRRTNKDGPEVREWLEAAGSERSKESSEESEEAERARETQYPAEDEQTPKEAEITHTWLMQVRGYFQSMNTYFGNRKGRGSLKEI
ncbi:hypothetical protein NDU88_008194 [Pleurodeles waltl]|uniref:Uncharacterized protein n=1 Tax=Pleurodeles waltl TaxID=8319 RepID=A0AAV7VVS1_PLEWA|nr:hypothetical protein NDU88_008194 [Pleurodeles waltl]